MSRPLFPNPAADWILLALTDGPKHGGAISPQIIGDTVGGYVPRTTLYRMLAELHEKGYIEQRSGREFQLTSKGRKRLLNQGNVWERTARLVQERLR